MELKQLYPLWVKSLTTTGWVQVQPSLVVTLKNSLLHSSYLVDLFGVDLIKLNQLQLNYCFWSYEYEQLIKLRWSTFNQTLSLTGLWPSSTWFERETWEMFGIWFQGHPDLRRLLTDYGFRGWPLLKSYPVIGYHQLSYSERAKRVISVKVHLNQEFRQFNFKSGWLV